MPHLGQPAHVRFHAHEAFLPAQAAFEVAVQQRARQVRDARAGVHGAAPAWRIAVEDRSEPSIRMRACSAGGTRSIMAIAIE